MDLKVGVDRYAHTTGRWAARFDGVESYTPKEKIGRDGRPLGPGLKWKFTVVAGPDTGKIGSMLSGPSPTAGNACGRMLAAISGKALKADENIDPNQYVGNFYAVSIRDKFMVADPAPKHLADANTDDKRLKVIFKAYDEVKDAPF